MCTLPLSEGIAPGCSPHSGHCALCGTPVLPSNLSKDSVVTLGYHKYSVTLKSFEGEQFSIVQRARNSASSSFSPLRLSQRIESTQRVAPFAMRRAFPCCKPQCTILLHF